MGTKLIRSSAYHPQTSGQTERVNQILEDLLRACVISSKGSWEKWLPLAEFSYNNSYQTSIKMAPFEALYGRKCRTPLNWIEPGERRYFGIDVILGMNWMKNHGVLIDTSTRTVMLRDPKNNEAFLIPLPREFNLHNVANAIQYVTLLDIPVVCEFPDVFPDELLGLPPDREIEFKIELLPVPRPFPEDRIECHLMS